MIKQKQDAGSFANPASCYQIIPFEDSLSEEQIDVFHKILDCVSETAAAEVRAANKVGFKDGATMMQEIQD